MTKLLFFFFLVLILVVSCKEHTEETENINSASINTNTLQSIPNASNYSTQVFLVDSLNPKSGFGYNVLVDNKIFVHQPSIPSIPGNKTFDTKEKAELVANLVAMKLKNNIMPPSISKTELDSLQILY